MLGRVSRTDSMMERGRQKQATYSPRAEGPQPRQPFSSKGNRISKSPLAMHTRKEGGGEKDGGGRKEKKRKEECYEFPVLKLTMILMT